MHRNLIAACAAIALPFAALADEDGGTVEFESLKPDLAVTLEPVDKATRCPLKGDAAYHALDGTEIAWSYPRPLDFAAALEGLVAFVPDRVRVVEGRQRLRDLVQGRSPAVIAFWHDRLFFLTHFLATRLVARGYPLTALVSLSRDGDFGETLGLSLGAKVVRGSTSRGGAGALRALVAEVRGGRGAVMVVDGPRGPRHQPKPGAVTLARLTGVPVVPLTWSASRTWHLRSWDRMEIPQPFSRIEVRVGEALEVARDLDASELAAANARLAQRLTPPA